MLADFLDKGVDPAAFARLKTRMKADLIYRQDNAGDLAEDYGSAVTSGLTVADVQAWPAALQAVTEDDVLAAAKQVLDRRQSVTGFAMAKAEEPAK